MRSSKKKKNDNFNSPVSTNQFGRGFHNFRFTCYLNATIQSLLHLNSFTKLLLNESSSNQNMLTQILKNLLVASQCNTSTAIKPDNLVKWIVSEGFSLELQHDAHEFLSEYRN